MVVAQLDGFPYSYELVIADKGVPVGSYTLQVSVAPPYGA